MKPASPLQAPPVIFYIRTEIETYAVFFGRIVERRGLDEEVKIAAGNFRNCRGVEFGGGKRTSDEIVVGQTFCIRSDQLDSSGGDFCTCKGET